MMIVIDTGVYQTLTKKETPHCNYQNREIARSPNRIDKSEIGKDKT